MPTDQHNSSSAANSKLAIVVVTHNRVDSLLRTLQHLHSLEESYPVVVVDNASTDTTVAQVRQQFPHVQIITLRNNIGAVARNFGVQQVDQPYIAFADDDSWWSKGALAQAIDCFEQHPRLALIMSRIAVGPEERLDPCCELMARSPLPKPTALPGIPILGFVACGAVVRRSAFVSVTGFNERFGSSGEESLLAMDLAKNDWGLSYIQDIVSHHYPSKLRDVSYRRIEGVSDSLWTSWLRRSPRHIAHKTASHMRDALTERESLLGLIRAIRGLPWVLRQRSRIPIELERQFEMLEKQ
jgi:N-acetylglucosaminyl-diphospho-decaprenol L-rhamnosyltransferase